MSERYIVRDGVYGPVLWDNEKILLVSHSNNENDFLELAKRLNANSGDTDAEKVCISRECAEYAAECMSAETRRVEGICERLLDGKVPDKIHQRFKLIKELRAALEKNNGTM